MGLGKTIYDFSQNNVPTQYAKMSKNEIADAINKRILDELGMADCSAKEFKKAIRRDKLKIYEIIEEVADQIIEHGDYLKDAFFEKFVELKNLALGDTNEFYVEGLNTLEVVEFSGDHFNLNRERYDNGTSFSVKMRDFGISVFEYGKRITANRCDYGKIVADMTVAINEWFGKFAYETFQAAVTSLPGTFHVNGSYDELDVVRAARDVQSSAKEKPYFVGTSLGLAKLQGVTDVAMLSNNMKDELNGNIFLRTWKGYQCIEIPQGHKKGTFDPVIDDSVVYIIAGDEKPVKFCVEGDTEYKEIATVWNGAMNADKSIENAITFKAGAAVAYNKMFGVIDVA